MPRTTTDRLQRVVSDSSDFADVTTRESARSRHSTYSNARRKADIQWMRWPQSAGDVYRQDR